MPPAADCYVGSSNLGYASTFYRNQLYKYDLDNPNMYFTPLFEVDTNNPSVNSVYECLNNYTKKRIKRE